MTLLLYDDDKNNDNRAVCLEILELASTSFRSTALQRSDSLAAGGHKEMSSNEYSCAHGAQINFGDLTLYFNVDWRWLRTP
jgi:hypothetical protein